MNTEKIEVGDLVKRTEPSSEPLSFGFLGHHYIVTNVSSDKKSLSITPKEKHKIFWTNTDNFELVKKKDKTMEEKYKVGRWYIWDGKEECPLPYGTEYKTLRIDGSGDNYWSSKVKNEDETGMVTIYSGKLGCNWVWSGKESRKANVVAFYVISYPEKRKKMTVAEISEELGYEIEIVKG